MTYYYYCKKCWNRWLNNITPIVFCPRCNYKLTNVTKYVKIRSKKQYAKYRYAPDEHRTDNKTNEVSKQ